MSSSNWHLIIITGASRGFGRAVAEAFCRRLKSPMHFILASRSAEDLEETRQIVLKAREDRLTECDIVPIDYSADMTSIAHAAERIFKDASSSRYSDVIFVSNAGVLGPLGTIGSDFLSMEGLDYTYRINFLAPSCLIQEFLKRFGVSTSIVRLAVVNVSSLWAIESAKTFSAYCASKAGMEMFLRSLADETKTRNGPSVRVLNYAPGPLRTHMQEEIRSNDNVDADVRQWSIDAHENSKLLEPADSAKKLAKLVITARYSTGAHIDYFDQIEGVDFQLSTPTTCCACTYCDCGPSCSCGSPKDPAPKCDPCTEFVASRKK